MFTAQDLLRENIRDGSVAGMASSASSHVVTVQCYRNEPRFEPAAIAQVNRRIDLIPLKERIAHVLGVSQPPAPCSVFRLTIGDNNDLRRTPIALRPGIVELD